MKQVVRPGGDRKPLIVVAEDNEHYEGLIVAALRYAFEDSIDIMSTDSYSTAIEMIEENKDRLAGVVSDINYYPRPYEPGKDDDTERCGFWIVSDARKIVPDVPVILQSDEDYQDHALKIGANEFLFKNDIKEKGPEVFIKNFKIKETERND